MRQWCAILLLSAAACAQAAETPAAAVALADADVATVPAAGRQFVRYLWLTEKTAAEKQRAWQAVSSHLNKTSRSPLITQPLVVLKDGSVAAAHQLPPGNWADAALLRLGVTDYSYNRKTWDRLAVHDPVFHVEITHYFAATPTSAAGNYKVMAAAPWLAETEQQRAAIKRLIEYTQSKAPILVAANFVWQTAIQDKRAVGYYGLLEVKNRADFEKLAGFDRKAAADYAPEALAAVMNSGVSQEPRRVERNQALGGGVYVTYDVKVALNEFNPLRFLNGGFKHNAEEWFVLLPNGMWGVGLFDDKGVRQDKAPDFVGFDRYAHSNDGAIHVGLSCFDCHSREGDAGLQPIRNSIKNLYSLPQVLKSPDVVRAVAVQQHYFQFIDGKMRRDRETFTEAVKLANGLTPKQDAEVLRRYFAAYDAPVTVEQAAWELGVTPETMLRFFDAMRKHPKAGLDNVLGFFTLEGPNREPVPRAQWNATYNVAQLAMRGLVAWPDGVRKDVVVITGY